MLLAPALLSTCAPVSTCALHSMSFAVPGTQSGARLTLEVSPCSLDAASSGWNWKDGSVTLPLLPFLFQLLSGSLHVLSQ